MPRNSRTINNEAAILARVINPDEPTLSPDAAQSFLDLKFSRSDMVKMKKLAARARKGLLRPEEDAELNSYLHVGRLLALIQAKARKSLRHRRRAAS